MFKPTMCKSANNKPTNDSPMRRIVTIAAMAAGLSALAALAAAPAQAQYYGGYLNQPRSYGPPSYVPPPPIANPPSYVRPRVTVTPPRYGYGSGAYWDYRHYGDPTTQDSLLTCAYC
jgi:hypothetical protein